MGRRRGEIEEVLRRVFFSGHRSEYIVYVLDRTPEGEGLKAIPADSIDDVRGGYIFTRGYAIPFHRVLEVRDVKGRVIYTRKK
ncbi:RNA repair domain-containing protein [Thermogladius sp. KZ2Tp1]|uniref:DUF504 domain-containing protein n=1 Tax=unclassified Thermogladius TaxID=2647734 RepID=UPI003D0F3050